MEDEVERCGLRSLEAWTRYRLPYLVTVPVPGMVGGQPLERR